jgi:valyl-tRNA synthetase
MEQRLTMHKSRANKTASRILLERYGEDCKIVVLEVCPLEERRIKEQWWMDHSVGAVNYNKAYITKEDKRAYNKRFADDNKEAIRIRKQLWHENYMKTRSPEQIARKREYLKEYAAKKAKIPAEPAVGLSCLPASP